MDFNGVYHKYQADLKNHLRQHKQLCAAVHLFDLLVKHVVDDGC